MGETKPKAQEKKVATKTPGLKREQSDIFKSFAKPRAAVSRENTESSTGATPILQAVCLVQGFVFPSI